MGDEMEGAVQQAAQAGLQFMRRSGQGPRLSRTWGGLEGPRVMRGLRLMLSYRKEEALF